VTQRLISVLQEAEHRSERRTCRGTGLPVRMRSNSITTIASDERAATRTRFTRTRESSHSLAGENLF